ncbi:MAG: FAD-dependent oxidoreductase, partial [Oscillospiraceae bacterium]|nr:FAD-dependent oxidoreductase [Oscillospiraceae bacterium]
LFEPIRLGKTVFKNRIFASPTGYQDLTTDSYLNDDAFAYYERKAIGGAASVTVGECVVDSAHGRGGSYHIILDDPLAKHSLQRLTNIVTRHGTVVSAELCHAGMFGNRAPFACGGKERTEILSPIDYEIDGRIIKAMNEEQIEEAIKSFADAALFAKQCGFGMVTVHGGHGWLISQFVSPFVNNRKDKWGGPDIENRMRFPVAVCDAIRKACGPGFPIEIRISGSECHAAGYDVEEGIKIAKALDGHVDLIHVSAGSHEVAEVFTVTHPSMFLEDGCNVKYAAEIKKHVKTPVATVGALGDPELMEDIIASGKADVVEIGRGLIADPDIPIKARTGKTGEIRKCLRCLSCFSNLLTNGQFYCAINPQAGHEYEAKFDLPAKVKKTVLIAGGGIAGMEAALTCADRGHRVILCEKTDRLGGALRCEENVPFKANLAYYLESQAKRIANAAIDVRLNTEVTPELAESIEPDVIIAALGARPIVPKIPGIDGSNVISAEEAYICPEKVGKKVVILGGGLVGIELSIYLSQLGRKATVIEMLDDLNHGGNFLHAIGLRNEINKTDIVTSYNTKAVEINENGVVGETADGQRFFEADTVIYAIGQRPLNDEAQALRYCAPEFHLIGDCTVPKNIMAATAAAYAASKDIGRTV